MWVVLFITIQLLIGPDISIVSDIGPFNERAACEAELPTVRAAFDGEAERAFADGELAVICIKVTDFRSPPSEGATPPADKGSVRRPASMQTAPGLSQAGLTPSAVAGQAR